MANTQIGIMDVRVREAIEKALTDYIVDESNKWVEEQVELFRKKIMEERTKHLVTIVVEIMSAYYTYQDEMVIKIPFKK